MFEAFIPRIRSVLTLSRTCSISAVSVVGTEMIVAEREGLEAELIKGFRTELWGHELERESSQLKEMQGMGLTIEAEENHSREDTVTAT